MQKKNTEDFESRKPENSNSNDSVSIIYTVPLNFYAFGARAIAQR